MSQGDKAAGAWTPWPVVEGQLELPTLPEDGQRSDQGEQAGT